MKMRQQIPNLLTYSRILVIPAIIVAFYTPGMWGFWISATLFAYASITDYFDGYFARAWQVTSNLGRFLDPIADKLLVATALLLLVDRDSSIVLPAIAILCREILVSGLREFLADLRISVPVSTLAKYKTAAQMFAIFLLLLGQGGPDWLHATDAGRILLWFSAILTLFTGYAYLRTGLKHM